MNADSARRNPASEIPNLFDYKYHRMFDYEPLTEDQAPHGTIGIPRVLNMYENYPFWAIFFKELGFRVVLSPQSTRKIYELGIESIPSESECYPAKTRSRSYQLADPSGESRRSFIRVSLTSAMRSGEAGNHYNCPMVTSYAENIKNNVEELAENNVHFMNPFLAFTNEEILTQPADQSKYFGKEYQISSESEIAEGRYIRPGMSSYKSREPIWRRRARKTIACA